MGSIFTVSARQLASLRAAKLMATQQYFRPTAGIIRAVRSLTAATADPEVNVVGVGIGRKRVKGKLTSTACVRVYVQRKLPLEAVAAAARLPSKFDDVHTDVIETGTFRAFVLSAVVKKARSRLRSIQPGCSVGFRYPPPKERFLMAGTLGTIVTRGGQLFLLSNNHVLAGEGQLKAGTPIYQPGFLDGGHAATDRVATLTQFVPFDSAGNAIDAAIAQADDAALVSKKFVAGVRLRSLAPLRATVGLAVHKVGRSTGYTRGKIEDISADVRVEFDGGDFVFNDQILIKGLAGKPFSDTGDSGSLVVARSSGRATGLLFAGSAAFTIANQIEPVLAAFDVALVK
jgi:hypothetical protein